MQLADLESRLYNCQMEDSDLASLIYQESKPKSLPDALLVISDLKRTMSIMHLQLKQNEQEKALLTQSVSALEDQKQDLAD